jgi:hypothetical protein
MNEVGRLAEISSMQALYGKIAQQTLGCADFTHYAEMKNFCKWFPPCHRLYSVSLYRGKTCQGCLRRDISVDLHCMGKS